MAALVLMAQHAPSAADRELAALLQRRDLAAETAQLLELTEAQAVPGMRHWRRTHPLPESAGLLEWQRYQQALLAKARQTLRQRDPRGIALARFDAEVNQLLIREILVLAGEGLRDGWLSPAAWEEEADRLEGAVMEWQVKRFVIPAMLADLAPLLEGKKGALLYVAVGCGQGGKDIATKAAIERDHPQMRVRLYCLDPYQKAAGHPFTKAGGVLDTQALAPGESLLGRARARTGAANASIVVGHYAFHHLGLDYRQFRRMVKGSDAVYLFESLPADEVYDDMGRRAMRLARDVLVNFGFDGRHGTRWVSSAMAAPEERIFTAYYLTDRAWREQAPKGRRVAIPQSGGALLMERLRD